MGCVFSIQNNSKCPFFKFVLNLKISIFSRLYLRLYSSKFGRTPHAQDNTYKYQITHFYSLEQTFADAHWRHILTGDRILVYWYFYCYWRRKYLYSSSQRRRRLKSWGGEGQKVEIFRHTAANFRQRRLRVLKISILSLNVPKWRFPASNFVLGGKFFDKLQFGGRGQLLPVPSSPTLLHVVQVLVIVRAAHIYMYSAQDCGPYVHMRVPIDTI